jgi:hypothetical protein
MNPSQPPLTIDGALYPDVAPPKMLADLADRVDFLARLCAAWDFGHLPDSQLIIQVRQSSWREAVDQCRLLTSPSYHLLRRWHRLPPLPYLGQQIPSIANDPNLEFV